MSDDVPKKLIGENFSCHRRVYRNFLARCLVPSFFSFCRLLYSVLPISVAVELRHSRPVPAKKYDYVTLLFSGIVGFGAYCAANADSNGARKIVNMLNQLYIAFDVLTDPIKNPNVYKVKNCDFFN